MCFSAEASFTAGAVLLPAGIYCLRSAARKDTRFLAVASLPFLFSIQQFCEGFVWVGLQNGDAALANGAALVFLFFALFFWPFWVSFTVSLIEPREPVRQFLSVLVILTLVFGWAFFGPILLDADSRLTVRVMHHSIQYGLNVLPGFDLVAGEFWRLLYLASICCPLLVFHNRHFRRFAILLAVAAVISHLVFWYAFESVWCYFAAVLSLQLCYAFHELPTPANSGVMSSVARLP